MISALRRLHRVPSFHEIKATILGSRRGIRDVALSLVPQGVRIASGMIASVLITRGLGPSGYGQYALVQSLTETLRTLSDLGIGQTAIRYSSRAIAQGDSAGQLSVLRWAFRIRMSSAVALAAVLALVAPTLAVHVWRAKELTPLLLLGLLGGILAALESVPITYYQSLRRFGTNAAILTGQSLVGLVVVSALALYGRWSVRGVVVATLVATAVAALTFICTVPKAALFSHVQWVGLTSKRILASFMPPRLGSLVPNALDTATPGIFYGYTLISTVIATIIMRADVWLIGFFLDDTQVGIYSAALRLTMPLTAAVAAVNTSLWPRSSAITSLDGTAKLLTKTARIGVLLFLAGGIYALVVPPLVPLLFGSRFSASVGVGQVLCLRAAVSMLLSPVNTVAFNLGIARVLWRINLVQLSVVLILSLVLLPSIGILGSAVALLANDISGFALVLVFVWKGMSHRKVGDLS